MNIQLKVLRGANVGKEYAVPTPCCLIGRRPYCHLQLKSDAISRGHCLISVRGDRVYVQDLKSHNGTFVNGKRILKECEVHDGETLQIGPMILEIRIEDTDTFQRRQARATENRDEQKGQPKRTGCMAGKEASCHHGHVVGKLPPRPQEVYKDSSEAAASALKSFFERRR